MSVAEAKQLLRDCESGLHRLLEQEAEAGRYEQVVRFASLAKEVKELAESMDGENVHGAKPPASPAAAPANSANRRSTKAKARGYPRFIRRGDWLIKIGWSKRRKEEYQHKAPKRTVDVVAATLAEAGDHGRMFQPGDLMPLHDPDDDAEVPAYQVYLTLAWLRELDLVEQHGREGQSVPAPCDLRQATEAAWEKLEPG